MIIYLRKILSKNIKKWEFPNLFWFLPNSDMEKEMATHSSIHA